MHWLSSIHTWQGLLAALLLAPSPAFMVKHGDFKTCAQSGFCKRQQSFAQSRDGNTISWTYTVDPKTLRLGSASDSLLSATIKGQPAGTQNHDVLFSMELRAFTGGMRLLVKELNPLRPVYEGTAEYTLEHETAASFKPVKLVQDALKSTDAAPVYSFGNGNTLKLTLSPFSLEWTQGETPVLTFNERGYLYYEHAQAKAVPEPVLVKEGGDGAEAPPPPVKTYNETVAKVQLPDYLQADLWDESFGGKTDSKPFGPASMGLDISFPGSDNVYGLPEHATNFSLKTTRGPKAEHKNPYRLYNLDVFEFELDSPMALYGSIPFMMSHKKGHSVGVFWMNAAEMWVDVNKADQGFSLSSLWKGKKADASTVSTHWMAETGTIDLFFFLGTNPAEIFNTYTSLTGRPVLPQLFAIGYHQCRWNYLDETDVSQVDAKFDELEIPYDVLWLDIEHTDGKRYFTWDPLKFPTPERMQNDLASRGRKMVTIIDPHIKVDDNYPVFKAAKDLDFYVKDVNGNDFEGWCWPGSSQWLDYLNPKCREYWAQRFLPEHYVGSTLSLYTWNDMNEPSVFTGPEITMPKDNLHFGRVEHRNIHNAYGMLQHRSTYEGQFFRSQGQDRPFVLSRAFFAGTQRYGPIWTGDNFATWEHLESSVPMLLTIGISGLPFSGADVGGFFGNPDADLLTRWYQVGAFQPFFRGHAHIDTKRREPWLFGEPYTTHIRAAIRTRYALLPYLYTLFHEASVSGMPVMRPMFVEFPEDDATFSMGDQFMLGPAILVKPVCQKDQTFVSVYLPKASLWYDYHTFTPFKSGKVSVATPLDQIPVFLRGGSIIPRRQRVRRAASLMTKDPFTLVVVLDEKGEANGALYLDDGKSFDYQIGHSVFANLSFKDGVLTGSASTASSATDIETLGNRVERVILVGLKIRPSTIISSVKAQLTFQVARLSNGLYTVEIKDPKVWIGKAWSVTLS